MSLLEVTLVWPTTPAEQHTQPSFGFGRRPDLSHPTLISDSFAESQPVACYTLIDCRCYGLTMCPYMNCTRDIYQNVPFCDSLYIV